AFANRLGGIVSPIRLAVLRLTTNSNVFGCSTGRSAGFRPFKILSTKAATRCCLSTPRYNRGPAMLAEKLRKEPSRRSLDNRRAEFSSPAARMQERKAQRTWWVKISLLSLEHQRANLSKILISQRSLSGQEST